MYKIIFIFLILCVSHLSIADTQKIVVLTSIKTPKKNPFWRSKNYSIKNDIQKQFQYYFRESGYEVVFEHEASAITLEKYLLSPYTIALFWVSHATNQDQITNEKISDFYDNNVAGLFSRVHSNLKFLSVIGCKSQFILDSFLQQGFYQNNPKLMLHGFKTVVRLNTGITNSIKASSEILDQDPDNFLTWKSVRDKNRLKWIRTRSHLIAKDEFITYSFQKEDSPTDTNRGIKISISNNSNDTAIITSDNVYLGILKANSINQIFYIPQDTIQKNIFKIKLKRLITKEDNIDQINISLAKFGKKFSFEILDDYYEEMNKKQMLGNGVYFFYLKTI